GEQVAAHLAAQRLFRAPLEDAAAGRQVDERAAVFTHGEMHVGPRDGEPQHGVDALRLLSGGALQELAAGGDVPEEIAHLDGGAGRGAGVLGLRRGAAVDLDARALAAVARQQREAAYRRHARERLAAEPVAL